MKCNSFNENDEPVYFFQMTMMSMI